ncbi:MAG: protein translocase subunit SecD [Spirochaetes bacterium]|nr:protein translocase subunit SecD [Spirochaetota bacterium]
MLKGYRFKFIRITLLIAFAVLLVLPTFGRKQMEVQLVPGDTSAVQEINKLFPEKSFKITSAGNTLTVSGYNLTAANMNEVRNMEGVSEAKILPHWIETRTLKLVKKINLGLDLQGGMNLVLKADFDKLMDTRKRANLTFTDNDKELVLVQALEKINSRIDSFGVAEPVVRRKGTDSIEIQLPGVKNPDEIKKLLKTTGRVEYRFVDNEYTSKAAEYVKTNNIDITDKTKDIKQLYQEIGTAISVPEDMEVMFLYEKSKGTDMLVPVSVMVLERLAQFEGGDIENAYVTQDEYGSWAVGFKTTIDGSVKFAAATASKNEGRLLAITIDNMIRSAPRINKQITTGSAQITGSFTNQEAQILTSVINEGALPVDLLVVEERTVGPSLGQASIDAGMKAVLIGLIMVMMFMILYYKASGIVADFCLVLNMLFMLALLALLGATLTLPGIAGFILTVGMSVDANVIIFERIKEELRAGKSVAVAVETGFKRAFWTIFDSNLTTALAAVILYQGGTGPIKGFAVILLIGIITSMFVSLNVSKFIFTIIASTKIKKLNI